MNASEFADLLKKYSSAAPESFARVANAAQLCSYSVQNVSGSTRYLYIFDGPDSFYANLLAPYQLLNGATVNVELATPLKADGITFASSTSASAFAQSSGADLLVTAQFLGPAAEVLAAPVVLAISPVSGDDDGGTVVMIQVEDSGGAIGAHVGGVALTSFSVVDSMHVTGTTGMHAVGAVDVTVTNLVGTGTLTGGYTYTAQAPTVSSITPNSGSHTGSTAVTIAGTNFDYATGVKVGGVACTSVVVVSDISITAVTGAHAIAAGVSVDVTTPGGTNAPNTLYSYT